MLDGALGALLERDTPPELLVRVEEVRRRANGDGRTGQESGDSPAACLGRARWAAPAPDGPGGGIACRATSPCGGCPLLDHELVGEDGLVDGVGLHRRDGSARGGAGRRASAASRVGTEPARAVGGGVSRLRAGVPSGDLVLAGAAPGNNADRVTRRLPDSWSFAPNRLRAGVLSDGLVLAAGGGAGEECGSGDAALAGFVVVRAEPPAVD